MIHFGDLPPKNADETYRHFFHDAEQVVAVSEDIKKNYDKQFGLNCRVIYPLAPFSSCKEDKDLLRERYHIPIDSKVICMVGSLKDMKNPDTILEAVAGLSSHHSLHIVYAGGGGLMDELKEKAKSLNICQQVTFLGNVPKDKVNEVYKLADYYLIASDFEGTSVSLLEAMFNRKAIVTSRAPGIVNTIQEDEECLMYDTRDSDKLRQCLVRFLEHDELCERLSEKAYMRFMKDYNYDNVISAYIEILNK